MLIRYLNMNDIFYQDDDERYYYCMDFTQHELVSPRDAVSGTITVESEIRGGLPSDLLIEDVSSSGLYVCMWISSGTPHKTYKVEVRTQTNNGARLEGDGFLRIGD